MGELVNFTFTNHRNLLYKGLWECLKSNFETNYELTGKIECNRSKIHILVFAIFCPNRYVNGENTFNLSSNGVDLDDDDLTALIEFIYRGKVSVKREKLGVIKSGAQVLGLQNLVDQIEKYQTSKNNQTSIPETNILFQMLSNTGSQGELSDNSDDVKEGEQHVLKSKRKSAQPTRWSPNSKADVDNSKTSHRRRKCCKPSKCSSTGKASDDEKEEERDQNGKRKKSKLGPSSDGDDSYHEKQIARRSRQKSKRSTSKDENWYDEEDDEEEDEQVPKSKRTKKPSSTEKAADYYDSVSKMYLCKHCGKSFKIARTFLIHLNCHDNPSLKQKCQLCDYETAGKNGLRGHMASKHQLDLDGTKLEKNIKCPDCSYTCVAQFQLKNHCFQTHSKPYKCDMCGYACASLAVLSRHVQAVHQTDRPHMCETCGYRAKTMQVLKIHVKMHDGKKVICSFCGQSLTVNSFPKHLKLHTTDQKPHTCHLCAFSTRKKYSLKMHLKNVHKIEMEQTGIKNGREAYNNESLLR